MKKLYCGACGNYLMGGDGECHDCRCGWKQPEDEPEAFEPDWCSPPGETMVDVMEENDWSLPYLKGKLDMTDTELAGLLAGVTVIDNDLAFKLADVFGSTPDFWLARDEQYRSALRRLGND